MEEIEYLFSKNMQYIGIAGLCVAVIQVSCQSLPVLEFGALLFILFSFGLILDSFCLILNLIVFVINSWIILQAFYSCYTRILLLMFLFLCIRS